MFLEVNGFIEKFESDLKIMKDLSLSMTIDFGITRRKNMAEITFYIDKNTLRSFFRYEMEFSVSFY
ncbi:hypothetical protein A0U92_03395 [Acetobacter aceti]|uniref:Uncharacterized protein n=1 Tax=Acetobacter aceti TaxID=435 RepID=A0A1U9KDS7_ACEAC|nr:hypothetical protein A0U92_03395 [Acetobacter aceti]